MQQSTSHAYVYSLVSGLLGLIMCLDVSAQTPSPLRTVRITRGGEAQEIARFTVEVADEPEEWRQGLMARPTLAPEAGMLFIFPDVAPRSFWMMNTLIALDILFVDAHGYIINIHANVPPCLPPRRCPSYASTAPAQYVLEIAGGQSSTRGMRVGDRLHF
jgi:uncharacterized membrane protein (UPF0127 family)